MAENAGRRVLVTGGAGFIGSHLVDRLLARGDEVVVLDNFNDFYNPAVKRENVRGHFAHSAYKLIEGDVRDGHALDKVFAKGPFHVVVHLSAMAGVRPSLKNPALYMDVNVLGTQRLVDRIIAGGAECRLVFGSSSSVYGARSLECFRETDRVDLPLSPYAASKVAGEALCHAAHHTTGLPVVSLRFFTVFGPRQRPDLAIHKFCQLIDAGKTVEVFGDGTSARDYTYVGDIVRGIESAMSFPFSGFEIINLGRGQPVLLMDMIHRLEELLGRKANLVYTPPVTGDVPNTFAGIDKARSMLAYNPATSLADGLVEFVAWHKKAKAVS
jgi:UDP-glucuronate 4-epimerase